MAPVLGYWDVRGFAQSICNLLVYEGVQFEDKRTSTVSCLTTILRHLGRKHGLTAGSDEKATELDLLEQQAQDLCYILAYEAAPQPRYRQGLRPYAENMNDLLEPWERHLEGRKWVVGDRLTYVDFLLYEGLEWHCEFNPEAVEQYSAIGEYLKRFEELPNVKEYFASDKYKRRPSWDRFGPGVTASEICIVHA